MKLLYIAMFALVPLAQAGLPSHVAKVDLGSTVHAYAHAAKLPALNNKSGFALRVWSRGYMLGSVHGVVVANGQLRTLSTSSTYEHGKVIIKPAALSAPNAVSNQRRLKVLVATLAPHNGTSISCGVMDGGSVLVHAALNGRIVTVQADNPRFCADKASKIIVQLLHELRSQTPREVSPNGSVKRTPKPLRGFVAAYFKRYTSLPASCGLLAYLLT